MTGPAARGRERRRPFRRTQNSGQAADDARDPDIAIRSHPVLGEVRNVKIGFIPPAAEIGHPARDTGFLLARLDELWPRAPHYKPLSVGVVLFDLVPAVLHQPDLFAADTHRRQKLSPLIDRINDRYGRCAIGFGLLPPEVRAFKGHAAFHPVPESWEF